MIVNMKYIHRIQKDSVLLQNGEELKIARRSVDQIKDYIRSKCPNFAAHFKRENELSTETITIPNVSLTKNDVIALTGKYSDCLINIECNK